MVYSPTIVSEHYSVVATDYNLIYNTKLFMIVRGTCGHVVDRHTPFHITNLLKAIGLFQEGHKL